MRSSTSRRHLISVRPANAAVSRAALRRRLTALLGGARSVPHHNTTAAIQTASRLVSNDRFEFRRQVIGRNLLKAEPGIERHVPRDGSKGCERHLFVPGPAGPIVYRSHRCRPHAASSVPRIHVDLPQVSLGFREHLDESKADRSVIGKGHPEAPLRLRVPKLLLVGRLAQDGIGCVAFEKLSRGPFDRRESANIQRSGCNDRIGRHPTALPSPPDAPALSSAEQRAHTMRPADRRSAAREPPTVNQDGCSASAAAPGLGGL
jgi:hypothetical protein